ncbi:MAG: hypothetical protein IJZ15_03350 [Oscillospiraceae bacterium]|nr:hypothetical protein [Oscillospiraceae bacterium]
MNNYYEKLKVIKAQVETYLREIFKVHGYELLLELEHYNLLSNPNNCIETSTATGFIMEEFIISKLEIYTRDHNGKDELKIQRLRGQSTGNSSYDCYAIYEDIYVMINIKIQKEGAVNNAVSAINILHNDYVRTNPAQEKAFLVLKTMYHFGASSKDAQRKILVNGIHGYFLEEIDFSFGHQQDHRNWSANFSANSGRLLVSDNWRRTHLLNESDISYKRTKAFIESIYNQGD